MLRTPWPVSGSIRKSFSENGTAIQYLPSTHLTPCPPDGVAFGPGRPPTPPSRGPQEAPPPQSSPSPHGAPPPRDGVELGPGRPHPPDSGVTQEASVLPESGVWGRP